jgi:hypothetical protein
MTVIEMRKDALNELGLLHETPQALQPGQARLKLHRFALTANNVTYAVFGERMAYWNFFPASSADLGRVPVWGFGDVVESQCKGVEAGTRLYGYFPLGEEVVVQPGKVTARGFTDMAEHRQPMAPLYNMYETAAPADADLEGRITLLRPLFLTGWLIDRWLADNDFFGATRIVASAASSKTALALASGLSQRTGIEAVALTSSRSQAMVDQTGLWTRSVLYCDEAGLGDGTKTVYVDFAGSQAHMRAVHSACGDNLVRSVAVGGADWDAARSEEPIPGPRPELFFAPSVAAAMIKSMGPAVFATETANSLNAAIAASQRWLQVHHLVGLDAAASSWQRLLANDVAPEEGIVITLEG